MNAADTREYELCRSSYDPTYGGSCRGTWGCVGEARKRGIPVQIVGET